MIRRVPYIRVKDKKLYYLCPVCYNILPRDLYKLNEYCPHCDSYINRTAKSIMKVYKSLDLDFYNYFIQIVRGDRNE